MLIATFLNEIYIEHYDSSIPDDLNLGALRLILKLKPQIILKSFFVSSNKISNLNILHKRMNLKSTRSHPLKT